MKKISILSLHLGYGGVEKSIVTLANLLSNDYQVEIVSIYNLYGTSVFPINKNVKVTYLLPKDLVPNGKEWKEALRNIRLLRFIKESYHACKVLYNRKKMMKKYLKITDADVIISSRFLFNNWLDQYGPKSALKIGWEHNHHHNDMKYSAKVIHSAYNLDYFVLVSKDLERFYHHKMLNYHVKTVYIPNTLEHIPRSKSSLIEKRLVSVGRLSKEKGYLDLLKIYSVIVKKYTDWVLDIVGDGNEKEELEKFIQEHQLQDKVTLHGFQNSDYIDKLLDHSSIYIMTSFTESFGIVLLEAMSHGLPCVAFDSAEGAREVITSGRDGYLIKNRNQEMMIKKITDLIKDREKRQALGKEGRKKVKLFSKESVREKWIELIEKK